MIPDPRNLSFGPLKVVPRFAERIVLPNGMTLHLLEDHELPVVHFGAFVRTGGAYDPPGRAGLSFLAASSIRKGGGAAVQGDALDEELDALGADLGFSSESDAGTWHAWCLRRHLDRVIDLAADAVRRPALPEEKVALARQEAQEWIRRSWDQPSQAADIMFRRRLYGPESPWGRIATVHSLGEATRDDLSAFHARYFDPKSMVFAAAGDFTIKELVASLSHAFGDWTNPQSDAPAPPGVAGEAPAGVVLVPKPVGQLNFRIGHLAHALDHPDHFALKLMDMVLGNSSFNSRLFRDIRTARGLAYSVWSRMRPRAFVRGTFEVGGETKYETCGVALTAIMDHLRRLRDEDVTAKEIELAKASLDQSFAFEFQSSWEIAWRQARHEHYKLPRDWHIQEREKVLAATAKDVRRVAQAHLHPDRAVILAVGDPAKCRPALEKLGPVTELPLPDLEA